MGGKGGGSSSKPTTQNVNQSSLPEYARPYFEELMQGAQGLARTPYTPYGGQRIADFTDAQQWSMNNQMNAQAPGQFQTGSDLTTAAGLGSLNAAQYNPSSFYSQQVGVPQLNQYQMRGAGDVYGSGYDASTMEGQQSNYNPNLQNYQMQGPANVQGGGYNAAMMQGAQSNYNSGTDYTAPQMEAAQSNWQTGGLPLEQMQGPGSFTSEQAQKFMNPYTQNVLDIEKRNVATDAKKSQVAEDLGKARQGSYGGSRALLAAMNREQNTMQQMGDVEAKGLQSAYEAARSQFNTEDAAQQAAGTTNLQARINQGQFGAGQGLEQSLANMQSRQQANQSNQAAQLQMKDLSTKQGMQEALANLDARQQAEVNNQAAQNAARGMSSEQAMQAALANQQAEMNTSQQNLQANLTTQDLGSKLGMQQALANLDARQQAEVNNQAARNTAKGMSSENAMRAALANQQTRQQTQQTNLQAKMDTQNQGLQALLDAQKANQTSGLEAQRLGEQSRQFGASNALAGYGQAGQMGQTLANLGQQQFQAEQTLRDKQLSTSTLDQALQQQQLDQQWADFMRQQGYPAEQLQQYSSLLHGVPVTPNTTESAYKQQASLPQQILGTGIGALGAYKSLSG